MANVMVTYFSDYGETMYDAISEVLLQNGNNVFRFNINRPDVKKTRWGGECSVVDHDVLSQIQEFDAQIVFSFNNCLPLNVYDVLPENCRVCVIDADAPEVAFWNKKIFSGDLKRFLFLGMQSYSREMYERYLGRKLSSQNYLYFPPATVVKKEDLPQDKKISFIGSNFLPLTIPADADFYSPVALKIYGNLRKDYFASVSETKRLCSDGQNSEWLHGTIRSFMSGQERLKYLQQVMDLGLTLYGMRNWSMIAYYDFELAKCFDPTPKTTLADNEWVYNTSKIAINISHPLAKTSFSWRVMDIMASNACLLTEDKPDWRDLFEEYLSKEVVEAVLYKDRFDLREKAKRLLADEAFRTRCVSELNAAIKKNGRWNVRFAKLQEQLNIKLLDIENPNPAFTWLGKKEGTSANEPCALTLKTRLKLRIKKFVYGAILLCAQIPLTGLFISRAKRDEILRRIEDCGV